MSRPMRVLQVSAAAKRDGDLQVTVCSLRHILLKLIHDVHVFVREFKYSSPCLFTL